MTPIPEPLTPTKTHRGLRLLIALSLTVGILLAYRHQESLTPAQLTNWVHDSGSIGMAIFILIYALATLFFLPGSLLTLAAGALFGPWLGAILSLTGATLGAGLAFLVARYLAGDWVAKKASGMAQRLLTGVETEGWRFVAFVRLVPIFPFNLLNYALGLTRIRLHHYLITSFICMAPGGAAYAWLGHAGKEAASGSSQAIHAGMWALGLLAVAMIIPRWLKRSKTTHLTILLLCLAHLGSTTPAMAAPPHPLTPDCLTCHQQQNADLITQWSQSNHNQHKMNCQSCHPGNHDGQMASRARHNETCIICHAKENKSYKLSKHGVIVQLTAKQMDFSQPLQGGNIRAPTCAYCHLHAGNHQVGTQSSRRETRDTPCQDCHSPRFTTTWFATGDRMLAIGQMKVDEANQVVNALKNKDENSAKPAMIILQTMNGHLTNIRLGVGHQSPDDQWWLGQPALDGDLLRIKTLSSEQMLRD